LIAKSEDTNEIVRKIEKNLETKADKEEVKVLCAQTQENTDFRKSLKAKVSILALMVSGVAGVITIVLGLIFH
jgi:phosphopantothenoylcysteine synthetase/decarboxylase